jgi:hypothetical protein
LNFELLASIVDGYILLDFSESDVPKVRMDLVTKKSLLKLAVRLMRNYNIADGIFLCAFLFEDLVSYCN